VTGPRVYSGGLATETNVFSPMPTGLADFAIAGPDDAPEAWARCVMGTTFARYRELAEAAGGTYVQGTFAWATPAGLTTRRAYETLRDRVLAEVEAALPLDAVLLTMHGAMVAEGYGDCETDVAERVREIVGADAKIGVLFDLHCDIPDELLAAIDVLVTFKEYPHVDMELRADELGRIVLAAARGEVDPVMASFDCRMIGMYSTPTGRMRAFVDRLKEAEREPGILSVSLGHGFPWGDAPAVGARIVVVADGDRGRAAALAEEIGREFFAIRDEVAMKPLPLAEALDRALAAPAGPVVVADFSDNAGGGAPSDSTFVLRELLDRGVEDAAIAMLWDPVVVEQAFSAGEGTRLTVRLGGKMGVASGDPLDLEVEVRALQPELVLRWPQEDAKPLDVPCGMAARLGVGGIDVIVGTARQQVLGLEAFTALGIDPRERKVVVVKSSNHFQAAFAPIAAEVIHASSPGALNLDVTTVPYEHVDRDQYPWTDDPWN
jgi:microcystin degradation protein MlrC